MQSRVGPIPDRLRPFATSSRAWRPRSSAARAAARFADGCRVPETEIGVRDRRPRMRSMVADGVTRFLRRPPAADRQRRSESPSGVMRAARLEQAGRSHQRCLSPRGLARRETRSRAPIARSSTGVPRGGMIQCGSIEVPVVGDPPVPLERSDVAERDVRSRDGERASPARWSPTTPGNGLASWRPGLRPGDEPTVVPRQQAGRRRSRDHA